MFERKSSRMISRHIFVLECWWCWWYNWISVRYFKFTCWLSNFQAARSMPFHLMACIFYIVALYITRLSAHSVFHSTFFDDQLRIGAISTSFSAITGKLKLLYIHSVGQLIIIWIILFTLFYNFYLYFTFRFSGIIFQVKIEMCNFKENVWKQSSISLFTFQNASIQRNFTSIDKFRWIIIETSQKDYDFAAINFKY